MINTGVSGDAPGRLVADNPLDGSVWGTVRRVGTKLCLQSDPSHPNFKNMGSQQILSKKTSHYSVVQEFCRLEERGCMSIHYWFSGLKYGKSFGW